MVWEHSKGSPLTRLPCIGKRYIIQEQKKLKDTGTASHVSSPTIQVVRVVVRDAAMLRGVHSEVCETETAFVALSSRE